MAERRVIAVDLGAESGRVINVTCDGGSLSLDIVHRFPNVPVSTRGTLHWDVLRLWHEISTGVDGVMAGASSVGVDAWGVDFALLDRAGNLLGNPVHYRDGRTDGMFDWVFQRVPRREVFERSGIQFMIINTLYQLASLSSSQSPLLEYASTYLSVPDLFHYWLTGNVVREFTHATTTQMYDPRAGSWNLNGLSALGISSDLFGEVMQPGTQVGTYKGVPVILPPCHDTASAVVAVPTTTSNYAYISSGTWSLIGLEVDTPIITDASYAANVTNEGGVGGKFRLLKNVMGLWLAQQCRAAWRAEGTEYDYDTLTHLAQQATPFRTFVDPDDTAFLPPGDMPARIREFCRRTGQPEPRTPGEVMRTVYESLALKYRYSLEKMMALANRTVDRIHVVGGGSQSALLNQMTADACNRVVVAGPVEATALGNAIVQLIALGEFSNVAQAREMLSRSVGMKEFTPQFVNSWEDAYQRSQALLTTNSL